MERLEQKLDDFYFPLQNRNNTKRVGEEQRGFVMGHVYTWGKWGINGYELSRRHKQKKYDPIWEEANNLIKQHLPHFEYTSIQFNKNNRCAKHLDPRNMGTSAMIGLGDYEGGELKIWDGDNETIHETRHKWVVFNGSEKYHETLPWTGERYTLVYYSLPVENFA